MNYYLVLILLIGFSEIRGKRIWEANDKEFARGIKFLEKSPSYWSQYRDGQVEGHWSCYHIGTDHVILYNPSDINGIVEEETVVFVLGPDRLFSINRPGGDITVSGLWKSVEKI